MRIILLIITMILSATSVVKIIINNNFINEKLNLKYILMQIIKTIHLPFAQKPSLPPPPSSSSSSSSSSSLSSSSSSSSPTLDSHNNPHMESPIFHVGGICPCPLKCFLIYGVLLSPPYFVLSMFLFVFICFCELQMFLITFFGRPLWVSFYCKFKKTCFNCKLNLSAKWRIINETWIFYSVNYVKWLAVMSRWFVMCGRTFSRA